MIVQIAESGLFMRMACMGRICIAKQGVVGNKVWGKAHSCKPGAPLVLMGAVMELVGLKTSVLLLSALAVTFPCALKMDALVASGVARITLVAGKR